MEAARGSLFDVEDDLFSAVAHGFALQAERALSPAPLRGYVEVERSEVTLRGRVRMSDQLARWPGLPIPLELTYDDHLLEIPENRLIRGATGLLLRMQQIRSPSACGCYECVRPLRTSSQRPPHR